MIRIGLTGSIGMGKSTTAGLFAAEGVPVNDADAVVHDLYRGEAVTPVDAAFPGVAREGAIDRAELARQLAQAPERFKELEGIVHPLVRAREDAFLAAQRAAGAAFVLLDIPLLFESGATGRVDVVVVASCDPEIQRQRVLARPGMTEDKFALILSRQMPDAEKRARADFIIDTGHGIEEARRQVREILVNLSRGKRSGNNNA
ncbi:dephospho-CoA kinase [Rhizobium straminoryzae]|uniref:Dephospho-CoA kinase n=1 Tax=Rhizobium straminoryzae TaxID=1387186 RepID=A0A549SMK6_9HYPH|nr:dephospho-CoA kinase [Rhizobium straminoryzae]TRL30862.1 dephospho-CoA kinase [Rhizobium straminoryzae]